MKNYISYQEASGEILFFGRCADEDFSLQNFPGCLTIEGIGEYLTHYVKNGVLTEYTESEKTLKSKHDNVFAEWSNQTMSWVDTRSDQQIYDNLSDYVRKTRNSLLQESDWTDTASAPARLGQEIYNQWQTYRQGLRDVTTQAGYPFNIIWPTPPQG